MSQSLSLAATEAAADFDQASVAFAGAATVVLHYGGFTVIVDPSFLHHRDHVHLGYDLTASGLADAVGHLPPVDLVLIPELRDGHPGRSVDLELDRRLPVVTTTRAASTLRGKGFVAARGLAGWETIRVERAPAALQVTSVPAPPASFDSPLPDATGFLLEFSGPEGVRLRAFVSADGELHGDLREIARPPRVDLAFFLVGGTRVVGMLAGAGEGTATVRLVAPRLAPTVPGDHDGLESPLEEFAAAARHSGLEVRVDPFEPGDRYTFTPTAPRGAPGNAPAAASEAVDAPGGERPVAA